MTSVIKKMLSAICLIVFCLITLGMGNTGSNESFEIPSPDKNYQVTLIDQSDITVELTKFSCNGQTFLVGEYGKSMISIDFHNISTIFFYLEAENLRANVKLKDGKKIEISVAKNVPCFGISSFADVRVDMIDIKQITFN